MRVHVIGDPFGPVDRALERTLALFGLPAGDLREASTRHEAWPFEKTWPLVDPAVIVNDCVVCVVGSSRGAMNLVRLHLLGELRGGATKGQTFVAIGLALRGGQRACGSIPILPAHLPMLLRFLSDGERDTEGSGRSWDVDRGSLYLAAAYSLVHDGRSAFFQATFAREHCGWIQQLLSRLAHDTKALGLARAEASFEHARALFTEGVDSWFANKRPTSRYDEALEGWRDAELLCAAAFDRVSRDVLPAVRGGSC